MTNSDPTATATKLSKDSQVLTDMVPQNSPHLDAPHFCIFSIASFLSTIEFKRIQVQSLPGICVLSRNDPPRQQEVPSLCFHEQGVSVQGTSIQSKHRSPGVHTPASYCGRLSPSSRNIGTILSQRLISS